MQSVKKLFLQIALKDNLQCNSRLIRQMCLLRDSSLSVSDRKQILNTNTLPSKELHTTQVQFRSTKEPVRWLKANEVVFPPTPEGAPLRPAEVRHQELQVRYQHDKMLYLCRMVRGLSIDEALKQLTFKNRAGADILKRILLQAQKIGVEEHNFEYKSNMWVAEAFPTKACFMKGGRKHRGYRIGQVQYKFIHVFVKLREGRPPENYYPAPPTGNQLKANYIDRLRKRRILNAL